MDYLFHLERVWPCSCSAHTQNVKYSEMFKCAKIILYQARKITFLRPSSKYSWSLWICPGRNSGKNRGVKTRYPCTYNLLRGRDVPEDSCPPPPVTYSLLSALRRTDMTTCCVVITTVPHSARAFALPSPKKPTIRRFRGVQRMINIIIIIVEK